MARRAQGGGRPSGRRRLREPEWVSLSDRELLELRFCDLGVSVEGSPVEPLVDALHALLGRRGLAVRPHVWFSVEWFNPVGVPGFALPFYLAHPRLAALERRQVGFVEGLSRAECVRILRHEAGHAVDSAFVLHRTRRYRELFGPAGRPYPSSYAPRAGSRRFVQHLGQWYAQSHPLEDFAETFAVWLGPRAQWRRQYTGWPALKKLEYVDEVMAELRGMSPPSRSREMPDRLAVVRTCLGDHYAARRAELDRAPSRHLDRHLRRVFAADDAAPGHTPAVVFLRSVGPELRSLALRRLARPSYSVDQALRELIDRTRTLKLRASPTKRQARVADLLRLAERTLRSAQAGRYRFAM